MIYFFILLLFYYISIFVGAVSWGMYAPCAGGIGAFLICLLFNLKTKWFYVIVLEVLSSSFGVLLSFSVMKEATIGTCYGMVIICWQLAMGIVCIEETEQPVSNRNN